MGSRRQLQNARTADDYPVCPRCVQPIGAGQDAAFHLDHAVHVRCRAERGRRPSLGRVLVVDDQPHVGQMVRDLLTELGYAVKYVTDGADALDLVPVFEPDLVLLDLLMPGMSGVEVLERLRRDHPLLPVIMLSGNQDVDLARRTLGNGAFDYIQKPFDIMILERIVGAALGMPPTPASPVIE
jgi:two-component system, response regulator, stage 0 sporulation protein F